MICNVIGCKSELTSYELMKQEKHPHTRKYILCKKHRMANQYMNLPRKCLGCDSSVYELRLWCVVCYKKRALKCMEKHNELRKKKIYCPICLQRCPKHKHIYCSNRCRNKMRSERRYKQKNNICETCGIRLPRHKKRFCCQKHWASRYKRKDLYNTPLIIS